MSKKRIEKLPSSATQNEVIAKVNELIGLVNAHAFVLPVLAQTQRCLYDRAGKPDTEPYR